MGFKLISTYLGDRVHTYWYGKGPAPAGSIPPPSVPRVFLQGPFRDLRLNANVDFSSALAKFVLAESAGLSFKPPTAPQRVVSYGLIQETGGMEIHRFYLGQPGSNPTHLLEIATKDGSVLDDEIKLYQFVEEINPTSSEDWDVWLSGDQNDPPLLGGLKLSWKDSEYWRMWGTDADGNGDAMIDPRILDETDTAPDGTSHEVTLSSMLYGRMVGEGDEAMPEWLFVAVMQQGDGDGESRWIEAYLGVNLMQGDFTVY